MRASGAERLRVEVLGPIRVLDGDGRDVTPDGALQRRLLALLVVRRGHVVSPDAAIEALWPTGRPRDPVAALQNHLYRLRRDLPAGVVESTANGYRLDPAAIELDADRLAEALSAGTAMDGVTLSEIETVLARWHGPAYPELADVDAGRTEASRLEELRVQTAEARAELRLAAGDAEGLVVELIALADEHPLRERPRALLIAALAATGRTVEALRVYDDFRRLLGDELGIEPSPTLTAQHAALLRGAPPEAWAPVTRLPVPVTSLIGREALVDRLVAAIGDHRLVTLVGPSGVGKTRLLVELGHRLLAVWERRPVVMCELAPATEDAAAIDAVAAALAIEGRPAGGLAARVAAVLGDTELVLLLDNCEHVLDAVAELVDRVLAGCPNVHVVATSQERLRIAGEQVHRVPTLPASADGGPAVELFVDRARAVAPGFAPGPGELATIVDIVRRLDGLPLAIELATARLHTLEVAEVAAGLDDRFDLLSTGYRTASRHGSLAAAMAWSFDQLDPRLQLVFADLSAFTAAFTAADAAAVCGIELTAARADLDQLVERSLVMRAPPRRFMLLETLRAFGAEQRAAGGRLDVAAERHARHQVAWIEAADRRLLEPGADAVPEIDAAIPELHCALGWLLAHHEVELAGCLVSAIRDYGLMRLRPDVLAWAERVAEADPDDVSPVAPVVCAVSAYAAWMAGDVAERVARERRALRAAERSGRVSAEVAIVRANAALFEGQLDDAVEWYRRGVDAAAGDPALHLMARSTLLLALGYRGDPGAADAAAELLTEIGEARTPYAAYVWYCAGEADLAVDLERARVRLGRAVELAEQTNASFVVGIAGASKASIEARFGDPVVAAAEYRQLIAHWRRAGMWSTQWTMLRSIAGLLARLERHRDAAVLLGAVRATQAGHRIFGADDAALTELAARLRGELGDDAYEEALDEGARLDGDDAVEHALRAL